VHAKHWGVPIVAIALVGASLGACGSQSPGAGSAATTLGAGGSANVSPGTYPVHLTWKNGLLGASFTGKVGAMSLTGVCKLTVGSSGELAKATGVLGDTQFTLALRPTSVHSGGSTAMVVNATGTWGARAVEGKMTLNFALGSTRPSIVVTGNAGSAHVSARLKPLPNYAAGVTGTVTIR